MRGVKQSQVSFTCLNKAGKMIPADQPIRTMKRLLNEVLGRMNAHFDEIYAASGRPLIPPERSLMARVLMPLYSIRSKRQFCERLRYDLLVRWLLDLNRDETTFDLHVLAEPDSAAEAGWQICSSPRSCGWRRIVAGCPTSIFRWMRR